jgi:hypothetical protein
MTRRSSGRPVGWLSFVLAVLTLGGHLACGASGVAGAGVEGPEDIPTGPPEDDRSLCEERLRSDREVVESVGPGAEWPNVRRVFAIKGQGEDRRRILRCREIDTNLDGFKDVARFYGEAGEPIAEVADTRFDGRLDTWVHFISGQVARIERDTNGDGRPDEIRTFARGKLSRVQRDRNGDGRPDVWEVYQDGRLLRIGVDMNGDGQVDRWDRDEIARRQEALRRAADAEASPEALVAPTLGEGSEEGGEGAGGEESPMGGGK